MPSPNSAGGPSVPNSTVRAAALVAPWPSATETVVWQFGDLKVDVHVEQVVHNEKIVCNWPACNGVGYRTQFVFVFEARDDQTKVSVSESGWRVNQEGIDSAFAQCSGWTHFFASLKARLEHGVDLKHFYCDHAV